MDKAFELAEKWAQQLAEALTKVGPHAADLALGLGRIAAAEHLLIFVASLVMFLVCAKLAFPDVKTGLTNLQANERRRYDDEQPVAAFLLPGIAKSVLALFGFVVMTHHLKGIAFAVAGVFHPAIYLAASALKWV